ncbi:MAG: FtsX-like permease family protein, partial [Blastocatellia bacterium]
KVSTVEEGIGGAISEPRFDTILLATFSLIALVLSITGIYGVVSYSVGQRTQEIGIRFALGATRGRVLSLIVGRGLTFAAAGLFAGIVGSFFATRLIAGLLYGVPATDPIVYAGFSTLLGAVCIIACLVPAWKASKIDPSTALRLE